MSDGFDAWIGKTERLSDVVSQGAVDRFCATLGAKASNKGVPPGFHWCTCLPNASLAQLGEDGHPAKGGFLPPIPAPRRMWAASAVEFLAPIAPTATIDRQLTVACVKEKSGKSGSLYFVEVEQETTADGVDAVRERQTIVYREPAAEPILLPKAGSVDLSEWEFTETVTPSETMLLRYSALTFNAHRIHYDLPYARDVEGYPALIVHAPLMATLLLQFVERISDGRNIVAFSFRGQKPAFCNQEITLTAKPDGNGLSLAVINVAGETVMSATAELG